MNRGDCFHVQFFFHCIKSLVYITKWRYPFDVQLANRELAWRAATTGEFTTIRRQCAHITHYLTDKTNKIFPTLLSFFGCIPIDRTKQIARFDWIFTLHLMCVCVCVCMIPMQCRAMPLSIL